MNEDPDSGSWDDLAATRSLLAETRDELLRSEHECLEIPKLSPKKADQARQRLDEARRAFSAARLRLVRALDLLSLNDPRAESARKMIDERYRYPSSTAAEALLRLIDSLVPAQGVGATPEPPSFADELALAMQKRGDNKKSAAGSIGIATKTLDRLLSGQPTKPIKQQNARRYIEETSRLK